MAGNIVKSDAAAVGGIPIGDMYDDGTDYWVMTKEGLKRLTSKDIATAQVGEVGWDDAVLSKHGTYTTPIAYGAVVSDDLILRSMHITATPTAQNVVGEVVRLGTEAAHTGYFTGIYSYLTTSHNSGGAVALYGEVDITATSALAGNHIGLLSEVNVTAGTITGGGKIEGINVDVNITAGVAIAQEVVGIEVDMRGIKADVVGRTAGIKVTKAGASNYLDYGLLFSNQFENTLACIGFDLTQGSAPLGMLVDTGAHTLTTFAKFNNTGAGVITNLFDFTNYAPGEGEIIEKDANAADSIWGKLKIINTDGAAGYINIWSTAN